jgi:hypothetical protein
MSIEKQEEEIMALLRNEINKNFTIIGNYILHCRNVSLKALGMYSKLASLPDNWSFTEMGLVSICKDGIDGVRSSLKELEELNMLFRFRCRNNKGELGENIYYISSEPMTEEDKQNIVARYNPLDLPLLEKPILDNPLLEKPILGNPILLNTNTLNTKISNTNKLNNIYIQELYNKVCTKLPKCVLLNDNRNKQLRLLLKDLSIEQIEKVFIYANNDKFYTGNNDRKWKADFDYLIKNVNALRIYEKQSQIENNTNDFVGFMGD